LAVRRPDAPRQALDPRRWRRDDLATGIAVYVDLKHTLSGLALRLIRRRGRSGLAATLLAYAAMSRSGEAVSLAAIAGRSGLTPPGARRWLLGTGLFAEASDHRTVWLAAPFHPVAPYFYRQVARLGAALGLVGSPRPRGVSPLVWNTVAMFNAGLFFECHEYVEDAWRAAVEPDRTFYHGLVQAAAGCYHLEKRNLHGARTLIGKALAKLRPYTPAYMGIDVTALASGLQDLLGALDTEPSGWPSDRRDLPMMRLTPDVTRSNSTRPAPRSGPPARYRRDSPRLLESSVHSGAPVSERTALPPHGGLRSTGTKGAPMERVFGYIDAHRDEFVGRLQDLCRQPAIAAQGIGLEATAARVAALMEQAGIRARVIPVEGGAPVVYGEVKGTSSRILMFYNHYDVQPPEPLDEWESAPFAAEIRDGKIYARGVADNKGNLVARICAVEAMLREHTELPAGVRFIVEGEEEIGSVTLPRFVREHPDLVAADACIWESGSRDLQEHVVLSLGAKGICFVELEATGASRDLHSSAAAIVPNPAWRLVWALSTFKDRNERVLIDGFYDNVVEPTEEDMVQLRRIAAQRDDDAQRRDYGLERFLLGLSGVELLKRNLFQPTCTICGIASGYGGQGSKTVLPHRAVAKLDFRLVPDQRADEIFEKVRAHLAQHGFADISVRALGTEDPARTPMNAEIVRIVSEGVRRIYNRDPLVFPLMAGTGPMHVLTAARGIPTVGTGVGYAHSNNHAPNENIRIADFVEGMKHIAMILHLFGGGR
jgi:acetylornithine deacetylase/succinyl-diaminopimelate desuccinylase-like protein